MCLTPFTPAAGRRATSPQSAVTHRASPCSSVPSVSPRLSLRDLRLLRHLEVEGRLRSRRGGHGRHPPASCGSALYGLTSTDTLWVSPLWADIHRHPVGQPFMG